MRNHSYENDFDLLENETACRSHFHMRGFALRLVLKQRHKGTREWPIATVLAVSLHDFLSILCTVKIRFYQWRGIVGLHPILCGRHTKGHLTINGKD